MSKGFIKRDISSLGVVTFEDVTTMIEGMKIGTLKSLGLDTVSFYKNRTENQGTIEESTRLQKFVEDETNSLYETAAKTFVDNLKLKQRYFKYEISAFRHGQTVTISGSGVTEGYKVEVHQAKLGLLGDDLVGSDSLYEIIINDLNVGIWTLIVKIIKPDGTIVSEDNVEIKVLDPQIAALNIEPKTTDPIIGSTTPNTIVDIFTVDGQLVGTTVSESDGTYSITPIGLLSSDSELEVVIKDKVTPIPVTPLRALVNIPQSLPTIGSSHPSTITPQIVSSFETEIVDDIVIPYISGSTTLPFSTVIVTINDIVVGRTVSNFGLDWKIFLVGLDEVGVSLNDTNISLRIIVLDPPERSTSDVTFVSFPATFYGDTLYTGAGRSATINYTDTSGKYYFEFTGGDNVQGVMVNGDYNHRIRFYKNNNAWAIELDYDNRIITVIDLGNNSILGTRTIQPGQTVGIGTHGCTGCIGVVKLNAGQEEFIGEVPLGYYGGFGQL